MPAESSRAVFLSYASQDAEAARRICEALRSGGVEVWFDADGGLEHGDEWDQKIRRQIKECVLFIPVISANTQAREEGYFRIEWELAAQRAMGIASGVPFILPVVIDDTREPDALVPDRFRAVQWTRLRGGEVPPDVRARFLKLWSHRTGVLKQQELEPGRPRPGERGEGAASPSQSEVGRPLRGRLGWIIGTTVAVAFVGVFGWKFLQREQNSTSPPEAARRSAPPALSTSNGPTAEKSAAPQSEARQLADKARALFDSLDGTRDDYKLAEELIAQAKTKAATDAEVNAAEAQLHERLMQRGWDASDARREAARAAVQRAVRLDPQSFEVRWAQASLLSYTGREGEERTRQLRELRRERPKDQRILRALGTGLERAGQVDEGVAILDESAALPGGDPLALYIKSHAYWFAGRTAEAESANEAAIAQQPFTGALLMSVWYKTILHGDLDGARTVLNRISPAELIEDRAAYFGFMVEWLAHRPDAAIARLAAVPRDWLNDNWYRGPKGLLVGDALQLAGRPEAAAVERRAALKLVEQRLATDPNNFKLLHNRCELVAKLGQREEAARQFAVLLQLNGIDLASHATGSGSVAAACALLGRNADAIRIIAAGLKRGTHAVEFTAADLRLNPDWDPLRSEPEFAKVIAEAERIEKAAALPSRGGGGGGAVMMPAADAKSAQADKSVAVLAFANLSDDKGNEYFSDGISDELMNQLGQVPGLRVAGHESAFSFKGKNVPEAEIAQKLGVVYIVNGSVRRADTKVRINARLINAVEGSQIWSESFTEELKDIFAVQDAISGRIAQALQLKLGYAPRVTKSVNPEAHRLVLEARHFLLLRSRPALLTAENAFSQAIAIDPGFAEAHAGVADVCVVRSTYAVQDGATSEDVQPDLQRARMEAKRAIELDPTLSEAHAVLGYVCLMEKDYAEAERLLLYALTLNVNSSVTQAWFGILRLTQGRLDEGMRALAVSATNDPLWLVNLSTYSETQFFSQRYAEGLLTSDRIAYLSPEVLIINLGNRARLLLALDRKTEAVEVARTIRNNPNLTPRRDADSSAIFVLRHAGFAAEAAAYADELLRRLPAASQQRGYMLAALGKLDEALPFLERTPAVPRRRLYWDPMWDEWRDDPRFQQLIVKLGCTEVYKQARETLARLLKEQAPKK